MRVTINGISFYTSKAACKRGVGSDSNINAAVRLVYARMVEQKMPLGIATTIVLYDHKMKRCSYDVQLSTVG